MPLFRCCLALTNANCIIFLILLSVYGCVLAQWYGVRHGRQLSSLDTHMGIELKKCWEMINRKSKCESFIMIVVVAAAADFVSIKHKWEALAAWLVDSSVPPSPSSQLIIIWMMPRTHWIPGYRYISWSSTFNTQNEAPFLLSSCSVWQTYQRKHFYCSWLLQFII